MVIGELYGKFILELVCFFCFVFMFICQLYWEVWVLDRLFCFDDHWQTISGALRDLVPFVQIKKREKYPCFRINTSYMYHIWEVDLCLGETAVIDYSDFIPAICCCVKNIYWSYSKPYWGCIREFCFTEWLKTVDIYTLISLYKIANYLVYLHTLLLAFICFM